MEPSHIEPSHIDLWSVIPNWISSIANVILFIIGYRTLSNDRLRIIKMEQADRQKHAENVYSWIEERDANSITVYCRNGGVSVVYDFSIVAVDKISASTSDIYAIDLLKPGEERSFKLQGIREDINVHLNIIFRDPAGLKWQRDGNGKLIELITDSHTSVTLSTDESKRRSMVKTIIWRIIGIIWTFIGVYFIILFVPSQYRGAAALTSIIVVYHHSTRMIMYYFYERIWLKIKWGKLSKDKSAISIGAKIAWSAGVIIISSLIICFLTHVSPELGK